jgi:hypothetical protein
MAATQRSLDQIDPREAWQPWLPSAANPWGRKWAAHLYRRAGFGPSRAELVEAERLGPDGTLDLLLRGRPGADDILRDLTDTGRVAAERDDVGDQLRGWWLYVILQGGHPLREKLTLFWHNHFATSIVKVQEPDLMFRQNCLLRSHALGRFGGLLQDVGKDPAMLVWLDSNRNVKGRPNENYAREVMELFSLGVGNYTERDVRQGARAFTGWHTDGHRFHFDAAGHDDGPKTYLGRTGNWNGDDIVRIILQQPACARFLVRKLYRFLISETAVPSDSLLEPLCETFRNSDYDTAGLVRMMLASRHFYSEHAFRQIYKSPVEYVLGAVQAVYGRFPESDPEYRPLPQQVLVRHIGAMGQYLFAPPNVKGWPGAQSWLNTSTVLERDNFAFALAMGALWNSPTSEPTSAAALPPEATGAHPMARGALSEELAPPRAFDPARLLREERVGRADDVVRALIDLYLPGGIRPAVRTRLVAFLAEGNPAGPALDRRVREMVHVMLTIPEYYLS